MKYLNNAIRLALCLTVLLVAGCASSMSPIDCGSFDFKTLNDDIKSGALARGGSNLYEAVINNLSEQLQCERGVK